MEYHIIAYMNIVYLFNSVVKWNRLSSVFFVVIRSRGLGAKQREWIYWKRTYEHVKYSPRKMWDVCFYFTYINMNLWNNLSIIVCDEGYTLFLSFYFPCSIWFFTLWNQNGGSYLQAAYRVAIVTCCWF